MILWHDKKHTHTYIWFLPLVIGTPILNAERWQGLLYANETTGGQGRIDMIRGLRFPVPPAVAKEGWALNTELIAMLTRWPNSPCHKTTSPPTPPPKDMVETAVILMNTWKFLEGGGAAEDTQSLNPHSISALCSSSIWLLCINAPCSKSVSLLLSPL